MALPSTDTDGNGQVSGEMKTEVPTAATEVLASGEGKEEAAGDAETAAPSAATAESPAKDGGEIKKWPGWPGNNVFRLVVPVIKVGSLIGKKGELIKKLCEETRAKIRVLDGLVGTTDRIVRNPRVLYFLFGY